MIEEEIRNVIGKNCELSVAIDALEDTTDLYDVGLTSLTTVNLMLALEDHFDVEFDDDMLSRETFQSISSLASAITSLK